MFESWQQRVIDEKIELDAKRKHLVDFYENNKEVYDALPSLEKARLRYQDLLMREYSQVLSERIAWFSPPVESSL